MAPAVTDCGRVRIVRDDPTVSDLVVRAKDGDGSAWNDLVRRYAPLVWAICRRFGLGEADCADVTQGVWLGLVEALPQLREPAALPGWLATTTRRECLRIAKLARNRQSRERTDVGDVADGDLPGVDHRLLVEELNAVLRTAFAQLEPHCQQLLVLLMQTPQVPYAEISARLGMPQGSIGPTRSRCLAKLRQCPALARWIKSMAGEEEGE
jgi:RNA polymerase sigma factor (sigma-70 family)